MKIKGTGPGGPGGVDRSRKTGDVSGKGSAAGPTGASSAHAFAKPESVHQALASTKADLERNEIGSDFEQVARRFVDHYMDQRFGHLVQGRGKELMAEAAFETLCQDPGLRQRLERMIDKLVS